MTKVFVLAVLAVLALGATITSTAATSYILALTLPNCCAGPDGLFAVSVAATGGNVLVGAPGQVFGVAALFDARRGALVRSIQSPTPSRSFGAAVAAAGSGFVVGAPDLRRAYLFTGAGGDLLRRFDDPNPDPAALDDFGAAVAGARGTVVVGAPFDDPKGPASGAVAVFDRATGVLLHRLESPAQAPGAMFGAAIAAAGDRIAVGSPALTLPGTGAVSVFSARTGALLWTRRAPESDRRLFGFAVALRNGVLLVGAPCRDGETESGRGYLLDAHTGALRQAYSAPVPEVCDFFGGAVALDSPGALIGARLTSDPDTGAAYLFNPASGALRASFADGQPEAVVGWAVAIHRSMLLVGAAGEDGEVRVYRRAGRNRPASARRAE